MEMSLGLGLRVNNMTTSPCCFSPSGLGGGPEAVASCEVAFGRGKQPGSSAVRDSALRQGLVQGLALAC